VHVATAELPLFVKEVQLPDVIGVVETEAVPLHDVPVLLYVVKVRVCAAVME